MKGKRKVKGFQGVPSEKVEYDGVLSGMGLNLGLCDFDPNKRPSDI